MEKPSYYSILPANVRYSEKLSSTDKLLFSEITALTNEKGYCWATNKYFAKLYSKTKDTISRSINKLLLQGFIDVKMVKESKDYVEKRIITIKGVGVVKNIKAHRQKSLGGVAKKRKENTKDNNKKNKDILFSRFWDAYNMKKSRKLCYTKFMNLSYETCEKCIIAAKEYSASITDTKFKKHPSTWLNQECWDDEITQTSSNDGKIKGGKYDGMVF